MKNLTPFFLGLVTALNAASPPPIEIATIEELRSHAHEVIVERLDILVPESGEKARELLSERFFSHAIVKRFSGVTNTVWQTKWDILAASLVEKAKNSGLDSDELRRCLRRINRGRNEQSVIGPAFVQRIVPPNSSEEEVRKIRREDEERNRKAEEEFRKIPLEDRFDDTIAFLPVAAFQARFNDHSCWVVLCTWEIHASNVPVSRFGHVCLWAVDPKDLKIVAFVACD